jgi:predicted small secreted protein
MLAAVLLAGCQSIPGIGNDRLHLADNTEIAVTLVVNGREVAVVQPSSSVDFGPADLGPMPWHVAVRTAGGRDLLTLDVEPDSVHDDPNLDGTGSYSAPATGLDLSCGQLLVYVGRMMPGGGVPGPGTPGDCDP